MSDLISRISLIEDARERRKDVLWDRYTEADDKPFDDLIKLCKRAERYRWHDLRMNPEDLPDVSKDEFRSFDCVHEEYEHEGFYAAYQYDDGCEAFGVWKTRFNAVSLGVEDTEFETVEDMGYTKIIAWREIELFMEGTV